MKHLILFARKLNLFINGVELQKALDISNYKEFRRAVFQTVEEMNICFTFHYKEILIYRYRGGAIQTKRLQSYAVKITLPDNVPTSLKRFENMCFTCLLKKRHDEDYLCRLLLSFFISYITLSIAD